MTDGRARYPLAVRMIPYVRAALANLAAGVWFDEHGWPLRSSAQEEVT